MKQTTKQKLALLLRRLKLRGPADRALYLVMLVRHSRRNRAFRRMYPDFKLPPSSLVFEACNHVNWHEYCVSGQVHARVFGDLIRKWVPAGRISVCEWGCGPGRIIRHMPGTLQEKQAAFHGTDYDEKCVRWCSENLDGISFARNDVAPPLPFDSEKFDCIFGYSVLTHLPEDLCMAWFKELKRVTKPGGCIIVTTLGERYRFKLLPDERKQFDAGGMVGRKGGSVGGKCFAAFHPPRYMREVLFEGCEVLGHHTEASLTFTGQDVWVVRAR
jgi:SAM-dependent methyltransferase